MRTFLMGRLEAQTDAIRCTLIVRNADKYNKACINAFFIPNYWFGVPIRNYCHRQKNFPKKFKCRNWIKYGFCSYSPFLRKLSIKNHIEIFNNCWKRLEYILWVPSVSVAASHKETKVKLTFAINIIILALIPYKVKKHDNNKFNKINPCKNWTLFWFNLTSTEVEKSQLLEESAENEAS